MVFLLYSHSHIPQTEMCSNIIPKTKELTQEIYLFNLSGDGSQSEKNQNENNYSHGKGDFTKSL